MSEATTSIRPAAAPCDRGVVIITVSDRGAQGLREDRSGAELEAYLKDHGYPVRRRALVPDEIELIAGELRTAADQIGAGLILTTGGTGVAPRDVTPEATLGVIDRSVPGMAEAMRAASLAKTPHAMLSRAVVGIRGRSLIVNLPGSPKGALENLAALLPALPHALAKIQGDPSDCAAVEGEKV
ncbi:MAG: molybdenum cofactor biosynthesis protein [Syntrophobacteraceae bacterium CG2_30_61_12]|nr:MAG: molybdenum cofactor biosynthesis protein [Syntrophobacteraceae bacterium CG2_30_61_12]PIU31020.1 MAG: molybdenum cofactor biosynthesis protein [Syntrophobacteraceae bacterium CG07_land_8_20_14_0_80_61_8]